jgi:hypothetical protein
MISTLSRDDLFIENNNKHGLIAEKGEFDLSSNKQHNIGYNVHNDK